MNEIIVKLRRLYIFLLVPALLIVVVFGILDAINIYKVWNGENIVPFSSRILSFITLLSEVIIALVLPIWLRIIKATKIRKNGFLNTQDFLSFQGILIGLSVASFYLALLAVFLHVSKVPLLITAMIGVYALYTAFPSSKRIKAEQKLFTGHYTE